MNHDHARHGISEVLAAASAPFMPHGHCFLWTPGILYLEVLANALVALAYYSIPVVLYLFIRRRKDVPYPHVFILFALFITSCGTGHLIDIVLIWYPLYWVKAFWDAVTATVSVATAVVIAPLLPRLLKAGTIEAYIQHQTIEQLERQNRDLEAAHAQATLTQQNMRAQVEAMGRATTALAERETRIADLRGEVDRLRAALAAANGYGG